MRRNRVTFKPMSGQLLFADIVDDDLVLDCVLAPEGSGAFGVPVTLKARVREGERDSALRAVSRWAEEAAIIRLVTLPFAKGTQIAISSSSTLVVLEPA